MPFHQNLFVFSSCHPCGLNHKAAPISNPMPKKNIRGKYIVPDTVFTYWHNALVFKLASDHITLPIRHFPTAESFSWMVITYQSHRPSWFAWSFWSLLGINLMPKIRVADDVVCRSAYSWRCGCNNLPNTTHEKSCGVGRGLP